MKPIDVEVVLAHYNGSAFVEPQLLSIINSTINGEIEVRIHVIDDHSNQKEFENLQNICRQFPQIRLSRNEHNLGVVKTFEKGFRESKSEYIMASDQDDVWLPTKIQDSIALLKNIEKDQAALVFSDLSVVDQTLQVIRPRMLNLESFDQKENRYRFLIQNIVAGCTIAMNRKLIELALPFPDEIPMHDYWLAACAAFGGHIAFLNQPTILYRQHSANLVGTSGPNLFRRFLNARNTLRHLRRSLQEAGTVNSLLAKRLEERGVGEENGLIHRAEVAVKQRNFQNLRFLNSLQVFNRNPLRRLLTSAAYLALPND